LKFVSNEEMADTALVTAAAPAAAGKVKKARKAGSAKPKKVSDHPKYSQMIKDALAALKDRGGSSRQAILKYIVKQYRLGGDEKTINAHLKLALRAGVKNGTLKQSKGTGASGSFRIGEKKTGEKKAKAKPAKKAGAAKPKKAKKPKAAGAKKAKAAGSPKKAAKAKPAKPKAAKKAAKPKSPKKVKAAKPKKARSPAKAKKPKAAKAKK
jgi:histone H1/5